MLSAIGSAFPPATIATSLASEVVNYVDESQQKAFLSKIRIFLGITVEEGTVLGEQVARLFTRAHIHKGEKVSTAQAKAEVKEMLVAIAHANPPLERTAQAAENLLRLVWKGVCCIDPVINERYESNQPEGSSNEASAAEIKMLRDELRKEQKKREAMERKVNRLLPQAPRDQEFFTSAGSQVQVRKQTQLSQSGLAPANQQEYFRIQSIENNVEILNQKVSAHEEGIIGLERSNQSTTRTGSWCCWYRKSHVNPSAVVQSFDPNLDIFP